RARCRRYLHETMIELRPQRKIAGRLWFFVRPVTRNRLVIETNPVERTINQVIEFRLEIRKSRESESVDPTRAGLVSWEYGFVDNGDRMPHLPERGSCR